MAADYDFRRKPNEKGDGEVQPLYPRIVSKGTIDSKRLFREIAEASSFTEGDLAGIMVAFQEKVSYYLSEGYHVKLGEIGYFSSSLRARPVMDKKEIRSVSISFDNVNFRATPWFRRRSSGTVTRAKFGFQESSNLPEETRRIHRQNKQCRYRTAERCVFPKEPVLFLAAQHGKPHRQHSAPIRQQQRHSEYADRQAEV